MAASVRNVEFLLSLLEVETTGPIPTYPSSSQICPPEMTNNEGDEDAHVFDISCDSVASTATSYASSGIYQPSPYAIADLLGGSMTRRMRRLDVLGESADQPPKPKAENLYHETERRDSQSFLQSGQEHQTGRVPAAQRQLGRGQTLPYANVGGDSASEGESRFRAERAEMQTRLSGNGSIGTDTSRASSASPNVSGERMAVGEDGAPYLKSSLC